MGKMKATRKEIARNFNCISVSYCGIQTLLRHQSANFYTCGVYGWNFDAYVIDTGKHEICITTGYRGMIDNVKSKNSYSVYTEFEKKAEKIVYTGRLDYEEEKKAINDLLFEYIDFIMGEE